MGKFQETLLWKLLLLIGVVIGGTAPLTGDSSSYAGSANRQQPEYSLDQPRTDGGLRITFSPQADPNDSEKQPDPAAKTVLQPELGDAKLLVKPKEAETVAGLFSTQMEVRAGSGQVELVLSFANLSGHTQTLVFGSGQSYDWAVFDGQDKEVYRWSHDKSFTAAIRELQLESGGIWKFEDTWNLRDESGPLPEGVYTLRARITASASDGENVIDVNPSELTDEVRFEIYGEGKSQPSS